MRNDSAAALKGLAEAYPLLQDLNDVGGLAVVGQQLGTLLVSAGRRDEGLKVLGQSIEAFSRLGDEKSAEALSDVLRRMSSRSEDGAA